MNPAPPVTRMRLFIGPGTLAACTRTGQASRLLCGGSSPRRSSPRTISAMPAARETKWWQDVRAGDSAEVARMLERLAWVNERSPVEIELADGHVPAVGPDDVAPGE